MHTADEIVDAVAISDLEMVRSLIASGAPIPGRAIEIALLQFNKTDRGAPNYLARLLEHGRANGPGTYLAKDILEADHLSGGTRSLMIVNDELLLAAGHRSVISTWMRESDDCWVVRDWADARIELVMQFEVGRTPSEFFALGRDGNVATFSIDESGQIDVDSIQQSGQQVRPFDSQPLDPVQVFGDGIVGARELDWVFDDAPYDLCFVDLRRPEPQPDVSASTAREGIHGKPKIAVSGTHGFAGWLTQPMDVSVHALRLEIFAAEGQRIFDVELPKIRLNHPVELFGLANGFGLVVEDQRDTQELGLTEFRWSPSTGMLVKRYGVDGTALTSVAMTDTATVVGTTTSIQQLA